MLSIKGLKKNYGEFNVLKGIDLFASQGDVISIIGSSGSGKSTLLRCINFLEKPTAGSIAILGEEVQVKSNRHGDLVPGNQRQIRRLRSSVAMVFQHFNLWLHMSVLKNVMIAPIKTEGVSKAEAQTRAIGCLTKVGLPEDVFHKYPAYLSGGQQQHVGIARALALNPEVLLFDEPTSALDPELVGEVLRVMRTLADEGRTMILVTHEINFAKQVSNKVVFLHNGKIEEEGEPNEVLVQPKSPRLQQFLANNFK